MLIAMGRYGVAVVSLLLFVLAGEPLRLDYDPRVLLPAGATRLHLDRCPVPRGFWAPLEEKGWVTECYLVGGDPVILRAALEVSLKNAGYRCEVSETNTLAETTLFYIQDWRSGKLRLFVEVFIFTDRDRAIYLLSHPPRR